MHNASQAAHIGRIIKAISPARLQAYYASAAEAPFDALVRYAWNIALCEAFYPLLHGLEVVLRNGLDTAIGAAYTVVRYNTVNSWLDANPSHLEPTYGQKAVIEAKRKLAVNPRNKVIKAGQLVAELDFGFWTGLLHDYYLFQSTSDRRFWPHLLLAAFPYVTQQYRLQDVRKRFITLRKFRNRVFHHEPVWKRASLLQDRSDIIDAIGWISPETAKTVSLLDRVQPVLSIKGERSIRDLVHRATSPSRSCYGKQTVLRRF